MSSRRGRFSSSESRPQKRQLVDVVGDGAEWIWNLAQEQFAGAIGIGDLYHARQHLWDLSGKLHPSDAAAKRRWVMSQQHFLDDGKIELLVNRLRAQGTKRPEHRDRGQLFRAQHGAHALPEVPKAGAVCRFRQNPHRHPAQTLRNVLDRSRRHEVIAVRCCRHNREFDDYWESRRA